METTLFKVHSRCARESSWMTWSRRSLSGCLRSPTERSEASGTRYCTRRLMATSEEAPRESKWMTQTARCRQHRTKTTLQRKISRHWMTKIKRFKEVPRWQQPQLRHSQSPTNQLTRIQEVNHTISLQRVRTIVRKEPNRTRVQAINLLRPIQTIDLTTVTDSSSSSNSWRNKINKYNNSSSQTITIAIVRVISEQ